MRTKVSVLFFVLFASFVVNPAFAADKAEWRDAEVVMSDGRAFAGKISLVNDQFIIMNEAQKRKYTVRIAEIRQIETLVEKESMEKKWFFKEDGRDEKVYTGEVYPVRYFNTRVTFGDGKSLEGHVIGTVMQFRAAAPAEPPAKEGDAAPDRFFLTMKMEGKVGEKLDGLVYAKRITVKGEVGGVRGSIAGTIRLPADEKLVAVQAIHCKNDFSIEAKQLPGGGFEFSDCTQGAYDLVVVSDKAVYAAFSAEKAPESARLGEDALKEIADWTKNLRDFFDAHDPLYAAGNKDRAYALVRMERGRDRANTLQPDTMFRRYEVWLMQKPADDWQIQKRFFISRQVSAGKDIPRERLVIRPELAGLKIIAGSEKLTLKLELSDAK